MRLILKEPPREFEVGFDEKGVIKDCGSVFLNSNEQITFKTDAGAEYDVTRKSWGFYATPSINGRLISYGLRTVLVKNRIDRYFVLLVEVGQEKSFWDYVDREPLKVVAWLDDPRYLERIPSISAKKPHSSLQPDYCSISGDTESELVFRYTSPPELEVKFPRPDGEPYLREVWQFLPSGHFVSIHKMRAKTDYCGSYVDSTYGNQESMRLAFKRIVSLSPEKSDNFWRFDAIKAFAQSWIGKASDLNLLDVGAGLGVFPNIVRSAGWTCTAIDPDERAVRHLIDIVGVAGICGDFMKLDASARYDIVTLNKVLEHVADPIAMLTRTKDWLKPNGFVYIEVPDGETARLLGPEREEFTIEHLHIFSLKSAVLMATKAGYKIQQAIRIHEPSSKYTIRLFLSKGRA